MSGITHSTALWYASRATGVVCLMLLTVVVLLGILVNSKGRLPGLPRFAVTGLHRSVSLLAVAFLAVHVLTAVADQYVTIRLIAAVVPFTSGYLPVPLGLGAVALDLVAALIITSLLRARIGRRLWRGVHWLAYAAYPVAVLHSVTSAKDLRSGGLLVLTAACVLSIGAAVAYRIAAARSGRRAALPGGLDGAGRYRTAGPQRLPRSAGPAPGRAWDSTAGRRCPECTAAGAGPILRAGVAARGGAVLPAGVAARGGAVLSAGVAARDGTRIGDGLSLGAGAGAGDGAGAGEGAGR